MSYLVFGNSKTPELNQNLANWAANIIWPNDDRGFGPCGTMGVLEKENTGQLLGVVVFHNWQPTEGTIEISAASINPRWMTRHVLKEIFTNCFVTIGCQLVFSRVAESDERTRRIYRAYGFSETVLPRMRGRNLNEVLFTLTDDAWQDSKWSK